MANRARFGQRRHDRHLAERPERIGEGLDALRPHSVVIRHQNSYHGWNYTLRAGAGTSTNSSIVASVASAAPDANANGAPNNFHSTPNTTLETSAPMPATPL